MNSVPGSATETHWRRVLLLVVAVPVLLVWGTALAMTVSPKRDWLGDFAQDWLSARNHFAGRPVYVNLKQQMAEEFPAFRAMSSHEYYGHPPTTVLLALPFGLIDDYWQAHFAWNCLSLAALAIGLWLMLGRFGLQAGFWEWLAVLTLLFPSSPLFLELIYGQFNSLMLLFLAAVWVAWHHRWYRTMGVLIALAASIKLFPAFLGLLLLVRRRWDGVACCVGSFAAVNAIAAAVLGLDTYADYVGTVVPAVSSYRDWWANGSLAGYFSRLLDGSSGHVEPVVSSPLLANASIAVADLIVLAATVWGAARAVENERPDAAFALCCPAMLLVSPIAWSHYFLVLIPALLILWNEHARSPVTIGRGPVLALVVLLGINPAWLNSAVIPGDGEFAFLQGQQPSVPGPEYILSVLGYMTYVLLALFGFALWTATRRQRREASGAGGT